MTTIYVLMCYTTDVGGSIEDSPVEAYKTHEEAVAARDRENAQFKELSALRIAAGRTNGMTEHYHICAVGLLP